MRTDEISTAAAIAALLALSLGTTLAIPPSGVVVVGWAVSWGIVAALVGWRRRSWRWVVVCPLTMLGLVLLWSLVYGSTYWGSLFVFELGIVFAITAGIGALLGTWWGKRAANS